MFRLLIVPLSEIKSCGVGPSFHKKTMKRRTLQACNLKHSIKKTCFLFWSNFTYLIRAEENPPPPPLPLPWLRAYNEDLYFFHKVIRYRYVLTIVIVYIENLFFRAVKYCSLTFNLRRDCIGWDSIL